jgi:uncharacterized protein (AIM24 family)
MRDQLLGSTQPVLSISLEPGETIVAGAGEFAWMTDSIQMSTGSPQTSAGEAGGDPLTSALQRTLGESSVPLSTYTAKQAAGTIAFASRLPGSILRVEVAPGSEYLVHRRGFLACTPGVEVTTGYQQPFNAAHAPVEEFILRRIAGHGLAWVELSGDVVRRELEAGASLRTHPWHIGMFEGSVAVQVAELEGVSSTFFSDTSNLFGNEASLFAVLSGPGAVWLQSMPLLAAPLARPPIRPPASSPALEGGAGSAERATPTSGTRTNHDRG